ncbi:MAG TPA: peptide-methionine (S)-S-oxide reductase MsrA [Candidatus Dormibacteraeota bacterium]|nr:peptide-methionine (S)-S-oxide reductase MsrA [Candidatus Dormibacteraeota bacterium]
MIRLLAKSIAVLSVLLPFGGGAACNSSSGIVALSDPKLDNPLRAAGGQETAVVAGGCFWGIQALFAHVKGVLRSTSGYSGGAANTAQYEKVCSGRTGHAEAVEIIFDPSQISYGQLLKVFFSVAHAPTELNRQGPDVGTQYRSAIFYTSEEQKGIAQAYVRQLDAAKVFSGPIVTQVVPLEAFYPAEEYHQDYVDQHPENMYIVINDLPKVENLKKQFPELFVEKK